MRKSTRTNTIDGIPIDDWLSDIADLILNPGT